MQRRNSIWKPAKPWVWETFGESLSPQEKSPLNSKDGSAIVTKSNVSNGSHRAPSCCSIQLLCVECGPPMGAVLSEVVGWRSHVYCGSNCPSCRFTHTPRPNDHMLWKRLRKSPVILTMSDTTLPAVIGGILGGIGGITVCGILVMRTTCPTLFARYFGWRSETSSFVPSENPILRISTPKEHPMNVYRSNKQLTGSRRVTS